MKRSIAGDATKLAIVKMGTTVLTMLTAMLLSRFRTLDEYGTYSQLQLVTNLFTIIFMIGLPNSINYFLAKADTKKEQSGFLSLYYSLTTVLGFAAGIVLVIALPFIIKYFNNESIRDFWFYLLLYPWTKIIMSGLENLLVVYQRMTKLIVFKMLYSGITLAVVAMAWLVGISFELYMALFVITEILFSLWVYGISHRLSGGLHIIFDKTEIVSIFRFCIPLGLASIVGTISIELDKLLIGYLYSTSDLAIYTNASKEMPVTVIATSITAVLMPQLVKVLKRGENEKAVALWDKATILSYIFIAFCVGALIVFAPEVISILYSDKYLPGVGVFRVYSLVLLLRTTYFGMILNSVGKTRFIFITSVMNLLLNVVLNIVCYFIFGFVGPAIATFISIAVIAFLQLFYTSRFVRIGFWKIFNWKKIAKISVVNIIFAAVFWGAKIVLLDKFDINAIILSVGMGIIWFLIYFLFEKGEILGLWEGLNCEE